MQRHTLLLNGLSLELLESSGSGSPIFCCHGNSAAAAAFLPLFHTPLARQHRLLALSFPGHGGSAAAPDHYSIPALGELAARVIRHLGLARPLLVGHSLGGHALLEASHLLTGAAGLMLISAPPLSLGTLADAFKPDPTDGALFGGALTPEAVNTLARCFLATPPAVATLAQVRADICATDPAFRPALLASLQSGQLRDEWQALAAWPAPLALLQGSADAFLQGDYFSRVPATRLWGGGPQQFDGCGHALHLEAPQRLAQLLARFAACCLE